MKNIITRHKVASVFIALIVVLAIGAAVYFKTSKGKGVFEPVKKGDLVEAVYGIGTVNASRIFQFKVGVQSVIQKLNVREGDPVKKGKALIVLDGARELVAPFDGTVTALLFKEGETIFPQVAILTLTDFKDRYLQVSLEQQGAIRAKRGQSVKLSFESLKNQIFEGRVESVYSNQDRFFVRIESPHLPASILPGMTADVSISIAVHKDALLIPIAAIDGGKVRVQRKGNSLKEVAIKTGVLDGKMAEVTFGDLKEGDLVLLGRE